MSSSVHFGWVLGADLLVACTVSGIVLYSQARLDDNRSTREEQSENVRFVRDRAGGDQLRPFIGIDLRGQRLTGLNLAGANFERAMLQNAYLDAVNLRGAKFFGAEIDATRFSDADLTDADFAACDADDYCSDSDLVQASFAYTRLEGADFSGQVFIGASFFGAAVGRADFTDATFIRTSFDNADLSTANFQGATFEDVCYNDSTNWGDMPQPDMGDRRDCPELPSAPANPDNLPTESDTPAPAATRPDVNET